METTMDHNHTNDDDEVGGLIEKMPHLITALIAVGGLVATYFMTIGDFKMKDAEISQRVTYLESKVDHIQSNIEEMKKNLISNLH